MDIQEFLSLVRESSDIDLETNRKMIDNHIVNSQAVIANIAALRQLEGDPLLVALAALEVAAANPQETIT